jgi:hypothetical protein
MYVINKIGEDWWRADVRDQKKTAQIAGKRTAGRLLIQTKRSSSWKGEENLKRMWISLFVVADAAVCIFSSILDTLPFIQHDETKSLCLDSVHCYRFR